ncbi:hypothetical protein [Pseudomonas ogarae]|uniref:hypothetical protein n=1 Tax=Pseudomonas ogarae (strain DSM 112162 / CECT 30235 / F113) TaxID=1114970 RepID=UPI00128BEA38|nr:hypothetical protein [Pseudomonas ogarae]
MGDLSTLAGRSEKITFGPSWAGAPVAIIAYIRATPLAASSESGLVIAVPKAIAKQIYLTYDSSQAVMVAWRLFREAIAHRRYTLSFYIGMSLTRRCPVNRQSVPKASMVLVTLLCLIFPL